MHYFIALNVKYIFNYFFQACRNDSIQVWLNDVYNNELHDSYLLNLTIGALMIEQLRELIFKNTGFRCSAGISNNKV